MYLENGKVCTDKLLAIISEYSKVTEYKIDIKIIVLNTEAINI